MMHFLCRARVLRSCLFLYFQTTPHSVHSQDNEIIMDDHSTERIMADQGTKRITPDQSTERGLDYEQEAPLLLNRSHLALLHDLAGLYETDGDAPFCDESFKLTPDEFWDFHESHKAGDFPCKIGKYEYDGTTLYFKNTTIVHDGVSGTLGTEVNHQLLALRHHPEVR